MSQTNEKLLQALPAQDHEYFHAYFYIDSGYQWDHGMSEEQHDRFFGEMKELFTEAGWTVEEGRSSGVCPTFHKGGSKLYCHPMELSGPCERSLYSEVEKLLDSAQSCRLRFSKEFGQIYAMTDDQYKAALDTVRGDIESDLMKSFATKRRNLFHHGFYPNMEAVAKQYRVPTLTRYLGITSDDIHMQYTKSVFDDLVKQGKILCQEHPDRGKMYRSLTGPEQLELARKEASSLAEKIHNAQDRANEQAAGQGSPIRSGKDFPDGRA